MSNRFRVDEAARSLVSPEVMEILESDELVRVSGVPLLGNCPDGLYTSSHYEEGLLLQPTSLSVVTLELEGYHHLDERYLGTYARLWGIAVEYNQDYLFGIRDELQFSLDRYLTPVINPV